MLQKGRIQSSCGSIGKDGAFTIYEDEGDNYNYEISSYATIPITYIDATRNVIIGSREGSFKGMEEKGIQYCICHV